MGYQNISANMKQWALQLIDKGWEIYERWIVQGWILSFDPDVLISFHMKYVSQVQVQYSITPYMKNLQLIIIQSQQMQYTACNDIINGV